MWKHRQNVVTVEKNADVPAYKNQSSLSSLGRPFYSKMKPTLLVLAASFAVCQQLPELLNGWFSYANAADTPLKPSEALAHTLRLLHPSSPYARSLSDALTEHLQNRTDTLPVCSHSKYLCQLNYLHNPKPAPTRRLGSVSKRPRNAEQHAKEVRREIRSRHRRLSYLPIRFAIKSSEHRKKLPAASRNNWPRKNAVPKFQPVPQLRGRGAKYLPIRIHTFFADFFHPSDAQCAGTDALDLELGRPDAEHRLQKQTSETQRFTGGFEKAQGGQRTLPCGEVRRFFQTEAVPAALWWLQRILMAERVEGPLLVESKRGIKGDK